MQDFIFLALLFFIFLFECYFYKYKWRFLFSFNFYSKIKQLDISRGKEKDSEVELLKFILNSTVLVLYFFPIINTILFFIFLYVSKKLDEQEKYSKAKFESIENYDKFEIISIEYERFLHYIFEEGKLFLKVKIKFHHNKSGHLNYFVEEFFVFLDENKEFYFHNNLYEKLKHFSFSYLPKDLNFLRKSIYDFLNQKPEIKKLFFEFEKTLNLIKDEKFKVEFIDSKPEYFIFKSKDPTDPLFYECYEKINLRGSFQNLIFDFNFLTVEDEKNRYNISKNKIHKLMIKKMKILFTKFLYPKILWNRMICLKYFCIILK